jgi:integrase/recombinase XerC
MDARGAVLLTTATHNGDGLVAMHLDSLRHRNLSPATIRARRDVLARLATFTGAPPVGATREQVEAFVDARRTGRLGARGPLSSDSLRGEISHLRSYFEWLVKHDYRTDDPTRRLELPKKQGQRVDAIPDEDLADAMDGADLYDRAVLALSAFAGLRAAEIAHLEWRDVNTKRAVITVQHGKGGKRRKVDLAVPLAEVLATLPHRTGYVIPRRDRQPGPNAPYVISHRASLLLGGRERGYTLHQCRHRFASAAYAGTRDIDAVQKLLGHASPAVTSIYVDTMAHATRAAVDAAALLRTS